MQSTIYLEVETYERSLLAVLFVAHRRCTSSATWKGLLSAITVDVLSLIT